MAAQRLQRYLLQAMYVDHLLGRVLDVVEQGHLSEEAILVVMSDHGASLLPGSLNRKIVAENVHDVLPVPVFIRRAGQTMGEVEPRAVQLVDLLPTVLAELGVRVAEHAFDGEALFANEAARDPLLITSAGLQAPPAPPNPRSSALPGWLASLFPDPSNPFRWGPNADLIGTEVIRAETGQSAFVATLSSDSMVGPGDNRHVSAHVFGKLVGATQPVEMAVAVGDRVAGVGTTYEMDGWQLSLMIDPSLIPDEGSTVELFEISNGALMKVPLS